MKRQNTQWQKILTNNIYPTKKEYLSICVCVLNIKKLNRNIPNNPIKKWSKDMNRNFTKEDVQMANKLIIYFINVKYFINIKYIKYIIRKYRNAN